MDLLQNRRFLSCKMSYHIRRTTCARLEQRFPLHNKFINPHLLCLGFLFQFSLLKHQSERYHEKDARTPYRPDSELRHGKRTKSSAKREQRDDGKVTFRSEPRPPTAAGQGEKRRQAIGLVTFAGMLVATVVGIAFPPAYFALFSRLRAMSARR